MELNGINLYHYVVLGIYMKEAHFAYGKLINQINDSNAQLCVLFIG